MNDLSGPQQAKQLLSNARGMIRRVLSWSVKREAIDRDDQVTGALLHAEEYTTKAIISLTGPATEQQVAERKTREAVREER
jgi:hypothetical protein